MQLLSDSAACLHLQGIHELQQFGVDEPVRTSKSIRIILALLVNSNEMIRKFEMRAGQG